MDIEIQNNNAKLQRVIDFYRGLHQGNLASLASIYAPDVVFEDPAHTLNGYDALQHYFHTLYQNVTQCTFCIDQAVIANDTAFISWRMQLAHPKLAQGKLREVKGSSQLTFDDALVIYQRDYFDLGAMLYEAIPVLGGIIIQIKQRLGK